MKLALGPVKRKRIIEVTSKCGKNCKRPADVAEAFAVFYEELYGVISTFEPPRRRSDESTQKVIAEELTQAMKKLKAGKACGEDVLVAEKLKMGHEGLLVTIAALFTEILQGKASIPSSWCVPPHYPVQERRRQAVEKLQTHCHNSSAQ